MLALCALLLATAATGLSQDLPTTPLAESPTLAANAPVLPPALATVYGVVRNAFTGLPLARVLVQIEGDASTGALTDGEGRFELAGVPVGPQTIRVRKPGYHDRSYATEDVDYQDDGPAHSVLVAAEMPALDFRLTPTSAIHGRVELSTGDPAQGITLKLLKQVIRNGRAVWAQNGETRTNGDGAYRFAGLPSGVYAVYTMPAFESEPAVSAVAAGAKVMRNGYASVFYPEAREFADATRIRLRGGKEAEANLLLTLEPFYTVKATAILPNGKSLSGDDSSGSSVPEPKPATVLDATERILPYTLQLDAVTHSFQANLPNGAYTLVVGAEENTDASLGHDGAMRQKQAVLSGFVELSIESHAVANLRIPLLPSPTWPIHLRTVRSIAPTNTSSNQRQQNLVTVTATNAGDAPMGEAGEDSTAEDAGPDLLELAAGPGPHWISTEVNDRSLCVDSFSAGGINLAREPLNVALGASAPPMELTLRDDCGQLVLGLPMMLAAFLPGDEPFYTVYVVPDFDTTSDIPPMNIHPSSGATLTVDGLTPGNYHVYTFDRPVRLEYRNPAVLAALRTQGQAVTITAGTTSNLVLEVPQR
jgi:hypothetical protein